MPEDTSYAFAEQEITVRGRLIPATLTAVVMATGWMAYTTGGASAGHTNTIAKAKLTGAAEVPTKGDPDGRGSVSIFGIDGDAKTLCYVLRVKGIDLPAEGVAAHIHKGAKGKSGPVVANLAGPVDGNAADCLTQGETLASGSKAFPSKVKVAEILKNPENFYVNVHNPAFPGGAIRGQLSRG